MPTTARPAASWLSSGWAAAESVAHPVAVLGTPAPSLRAGVPTTFQGVSVLTSPPTDTVVVGCGNLLRGDDAAGPVLVRMLAERELRPGVRLIDGGTAGMDVAFAMRGARRVIVVDASAIGVEAGTVHRVPGSELMNLAPPEGNLHRVRWDQALGFAQWLLKDEYPDDVTVWLVEGSSFDVGAPLTSAVESSLNTIADEIVADLNSEHPPPPVEEDA